MKYIFAILFFTVLLTGTVLAQLPAPIMPGPPPQAPIDGGLLILAAGGGLYALNKLKNKK